MSEGIGELKVVNPTKTRPYVLEQVRGKRRADVRPTERVIAPGPVFLGIDVHKESLHMTVLDSAGDIVVTLTVPYAREHVAGLVARLAGHPVHAVYEAGPTGFALLQWLRDLGCIAFVTPPSLVPTRLGDRVKTDKKDSLKLAMWLSSKQLGSVYELTAEEQVDRELVRTYHQLREHERDLVRQIKSKCLFHGIATPWGEAGHQVKGLRRSDVQWLLSSPTGKLSLDHVLGSLARAYCVAKQEADGLAKKLEELAKTKRYGERAALLIGIMGGVSGVGVVTGMTWLLEIPRVEEFRTAEALAKWIGLVPSEHSTGDAGDPDKKQRGPITRAGNKVVRTALILVAWGMLAHDPSLKRFYEAQRKRGKPPQKAIVAVAHKIARRFYAVMRTKKPYLIPADEPQTASPPGTEVSTEPT